MIQFLNDIDKCLDVLHNGGLILYPTDTIWGIGCDATNAFAVSKIYALKKRATNKNMIILLAEETAILTYVDQPNLLIFDFIKGVSKPTTVIYEGAKLLAENLIGEDKTIAIRVVNDEFCKQLIHQFNKPLVSTSANISGYPAPEVYGDIDVTIKNGVDYIVQHRQNDLSISIPSTIIKWDKSGIPIVIRN